MASYRLIDELPTSHKRRPPFSPLGLFFLTWLCLPVSVPFWFLNWGRLGHPEKRLLAAFAGVVAFALPFIIWRVTASQETARTVNTLAKFAFGYFQLYGQRPIYSAYINRGGQKSPSWPVWLAVVSGLCYLLLLSPFF